MRKLMWFAVGFVCACLLAVYALPESWLGWAGIAAALIAAVSWLFQRGQTTNAPHPPQCKRGQRQGPGGALRAVPESYARRHKPCLWAASHWSRNDRMGKA